MYHRAMLPDPDTVRCTIEDSGPGIGTEHFPRFSIASSLPKTPAWAWAWPSVAPLSKHIAAGSVPTTTLRWVERGSFLNCLQASLRRVKINHINGFTGRRRAETSCLRARMQKRERHYPTHTLK
jgi:hypothetical protein